MSVKLTIFNVTGPVYNEISSARSITFCFALSLVYGGAWKYVAEIFTPLFEIIYPATGESIPPDKRSIARPAVPSGRPPWPGILCE